MTKEQRHTYQGIALAVAAVARDSDEPSVAANVLAGLGIDLADFVAAGVDPYDLKVIRKLYRTEYVLKPAKAA